MLSVNIKTHCSFLTDAARFLPPTIDSGTPIAFRRADFAISQKNTARLAESIDLLDYDLRPNTRSLSSLDKKMVTNFSIASLCNIPLLLRGQMQRTRQTNSRHLRQVRNFTA